MKKFVSLLMTVLMLAAMLTVFAIPAAALNLSGELCKSKTYIEPVTINGDATVNSKANLIFDMPLTVNFGATLTVESGASVTAKTMTVSGNMTVKPGGTVEFPSALVFNPNSKLEIGGTLRGTWNVNGNPCSTDNITLLPGGKIEVKFKNETFANKFAQGLRDYKPTVSNINDNGYQYLLTAENPVTETACPHDQGFTEDGKCKNCDWQCPHEEWNDGVCSLCGHECKHEEHVTEVVSAEKEYCSDCKKTLSLTEIPAETAPTNNETTPETEPLTASTLSEGSLAVICTIAGIAVGFLVAMFIFKKKKPAVAGGVETDEE